MVSALACGNKWMQVGTYNFESKYPALQSLASQNPGGGGEGGGLLKYDLGRDVPQRLEKYTHFYTKFC